MLVRDMIKHDVHRVVANIISRVCRFSGLQSDLDFESRAAMRRSIRGNPLWSMGCPHAFSIRGRRFDFDPLPRALAQPEHGVRPISLYRLNKLLSIKAHRKNDFLELIRLRQLVDDLGANIIAKLSIRSKTVDQNTHGI